MKILVVDDEALIRESIIRLLNGMERIETEEARDGIEALETIGRSRPDIVIADIRMPGMDGLTLMDRVKEMKWDVLFIFVSGYDVFEYAQKAVRLGAFGYLLKPIKEHEFKAALDQAFENRSYERRQRQMMARMESAMNQGIHLMRKRFLHDLARDNVYSDKYIRDKLDELDIRFPEPLFSALYVSIDNYNVLSDGLSSKDKEMLKFSLENIASEVITAHDAIAYSFELEDGIGIALNYAESHSLARPERLYAMCSEVKDCIARYTKITVTIGIGGKVDRLTSIKSSLEVAEQAVLQRLVKGTNRVIRIDDSASEPQSFNTISLKKEQDLIRYFEQRDEQAALRFVEELFEPFRNAAAVDVNRLMKLHFQLIMLMFKILNHMGVNPEETLGDEFKLYGQVNSCGNIDAVVGWFALKVGVCFELVRSKKENGQTNLIVKAKTFIQRNYNKEITLENLADHVHLSPPYLSKLFKEEAGENFSAYLLNYRMNIARGLLKEGIYKAHQVAEMVGFQNEKYFFKVFKREFGITPSEYKNS